MSKFKNNKRFGPWFNKHYVLTTNTGVLTLCDFKVNYGYMGNVDGICVEEKADLAYDVRLIYGDYGK